MLNSEAMGAPIYPAGARVETPAPTSAARRIGQEAIRAYDIRGIVGRSLTPAGLYQLGLSYSELAQRSGIRRIAVGRDGRTSSRALERALVQGLVEGGLQVTLLGLGPTPMTAFAVRTLGLEGGITVTASHNPPEENGLKLLLSDQRIHGEALKALVALDGQSRPGGSVRRVDVRAAYLQGLVRPAADLPPIAVAWDCGNGATGPLVERLVARLPGRHVLLHTKVDGRFPNHHPDPAVEENLADLKSAVQAQGCDLGIAFDGDGDRVGVVDCIGEVLWADQLLLFLAQDLLLERPGATVVADVKSSRLLFDGVRVCGGRAVMAPSGYVLIRETMRREAALLGGELSGHIFFADAWHGVDDALYAAMRTLLALARSGMTLRQFRQSLPPTIATPEFRIACSRPAQVVAQTAARLSAAGALFDDRMGLRVSTPDGWWLLRTSGTEPKITCRCEAADAFALARLNSELCGHLWACGVEPPAGLQPTRGWTASSSSNDIACR